MNTAQAMKNPDALEKHILRLMFDDGFGFDEAEAASKEYAADIFGRVSRTGRLIVEVAIRRMRRNVIGKR